VQTVETSRAEPGTGFPPLFLCSCGGHPSIPIAAALVARPPPAAI